MNFLKETFLDHSWKAWKSYIVGFFAGFLLVIGSELAWKVWVAEGPATILLAEESLVQVQGTKVLVHLDLLHKRNFCQGAEITRLLVHYPPNVRPDHTNFDYAEQIEQTAPYINEPGIYHFTAVMSIKVPLPALPGQWSFISSSYNGCTLLGKLGADTALVSPIVPVKVEN